MPIYVQVNFRGTFESEQSLIDANSHRKSQPNLYNVFSNDRYPVCDGILRVALKCLKDVAKSDFAGGYVIGKMSCSLISKACSAFAGKDDIDSNNESKRKLTRYQCCSSDPRMLAVIIRE